MVLTQETLQVAADVLLGNISIAPKKNKEKIILKQHFQVSLVLTFRNISNTFLLLCFTPPTRIVKKINECSRQSSHIKSTARRNSPSSDDLAIPDTRSGRLWYSHVQLRESLCLNTIPAV